MVRTAGRSNWRPSGLKRTELVLPLICSPVILTRLERAPRGMTSWWLPTFSTPPSGPITSLSIAYGWGEQSSRSVTEPRVPTTVVVSPLTVLVSPSVRSPIRPNCGVGWSAGSVSAESPVVQLTPTRSSSESPSTENLRFQLIMPLQARVRSMRRYRDRNGRRTSRRIIPRLIVRTWGLTRVGSLGTRNLLSGGHLAGKDQASQSGGPSRIWATKIDAIGSFRGIQNLTGRTGENRRVSRRSATFRGARFGAVGPGILRRIASRV